MSRSIWSGVAVRSRHVRPRSRGGRRAAPVPFDAAVAPDSRVVRGVHRHTPSRALSAQRGGFLSGVGQDELLLGRRPPRRNRPITRAIPTKPRMIPALAMPSPLWRPPAASIWPSATKPRTMRDDRADAAQDPADQPEDERSDRQAVGAAVMRIDARRELAVPGRRIRILRRHIWRGVRIGGDRARGARRRRVGRRWGCTAGRRRGGAGRRTVRGRRGGPGARRGSRPAAVRRPPQGFGCRRASRAARPRACVRAVGLGRGRGARTDARRRETRVKVERLAGRTPQASWTAVGDTCTRRLEPYVGRRTSDRHDATVTKCGVTDSCQLR